MDKEFVKGKDVQLNSTRSHFGDRSEERDINKEESYQGEADDQADRVVHAPLPTGPAESGDAPQDESSSGPIKASSGLPSPKEIGTQFGVGERGLRGYPADTIGVLDTKSFMVMTNAEVWGYAKNATKNFNYMTLDKFFNDPPGPSSVDLFDPYIIRDAISDQCICVALNSFSSGAPGIYFGSTYESDVMGNWQYTWMGAGQLGLATNEWVDYPRIGSNNDFIVVSGNVYSGPSATATYVNTIVLVIEKAPYYATGALNMSTFRASTGFTAVPCRSHDAAASMWILATGSANVSGDCTVNVYEVTGSFANSDVAIGAATVVTVPNLAWNTAGPKPGGAQKGGPDNLDVGDSRMQSAEIRNNLIWCTHGVWLPVSGAATHAGINAYCIDVSSGTPVLSQASVFEDTTAAINYGAPSIAVNSLGDVLIGMSKFSKSEYPQGTYTSRAVADPINTLREPGSTINSSTNWSKERWGDYSASIVDTNDDLTFWTLQMGVGTLVITKWFTKWMHVPQIT